MSQLMDVVEEIVVDELLKPETAIRILRAVIAAARHAPDADPENVRELVGKMREQLSSNDAKHDAELEDKFGSEK